MARMNTHELDARMNFMIYGTTYSLSTGRLRVKFALVERGWAVTSHL